MPIKMVRRKQLLGSQEMGKGRPKVSHNPTGRGKKQKGAKLTASSSRNRNTRGV